MHASSLQRPAADICWVGVPGWEEGRTLPEHGSRVSAPAAGAGGAPGGGGGGGGGGSSGGGSPTSSIPARSNRRNYGAPFSGWKQQLVSRIGGLDHGPSFSIMVSQSSFRAGTFDGLAQPDAGDERAGEVLSASQQPHHHHPATAAAAAGPQAKR